VDGKVRTILGKGTVCGEGTYPHLRTCTHMFTHMLGVSVGIHYRPPLEIWRYIWPRGDVDGWW